MKSRTECRVGVGVRGSDPSGRSRNNYAETNRSRPALILMVNLDTVTRFGANFDESGEFWCTLRLAVFVRSFVVESHLELFAAYLQSNSDDWRM